MKVLIWIIFMTTPGIVTVLLRNAGISLGGIPVALLYGVCLYAARTLSVKADIWKFEKIARSAGKTPMEYAKAKFDPIILEACELSKYNKAELKKQLKHYSGVGSITSADANFLYNLFLGK